MLKTIRCTVNGKARELSFDVRASLLEVLRAEGLTSSKQGCGVGECGACTVLVDNIPVDSCIFLAVWADGKTIRTAEGEAKGLINAAKELGASYEKTLDMVVDKLHISHEDGKKYMDMYWNA